MNGDNQLSNDPEEQKAYRVAYLITGYIRNNLTEAERDELDDWVTASDNNMQLFADMTDEKNLEKELKKRNLHDPEKALQRVNQKIRKKPIQKISFKKITPLAIGIAASLILLIGTLWWIYVKPNNQPSMAALTINDLQPGSDKALLSLPGGEKIILDSFSQQIMIEKIPGVTIDNGKLVYHNISGEIAYHTLTTPAGGQYKLRLPDGTDVWLNAASSITYPTAFTGNERKVTITGEAYFEVSPNHSEVGKRPFIVSNGNMQVLVLGTHFNVNSYNDEDATKVTLMEGSIEIKSKSSKVKLKPGQQAVLSSDKLRTSSARDDIKVLSTVDIEQVIAWKNGLFEFKDASIINIMRQVARWYDVDVQYQDRIDKHFNASISRDVPASKLFQLLELTNNVHFELKENTVIVKR